MSDRKLRRARPASSAPSHQQPPKTAAGSSRKLDRGDRRHARTRRARDGRSATLEGREEGSRTRRRARGRVPSCRGGRAAARPDAHARLGGAQPGRPRPRPTARAARSRASPRTSPARRPRRRRGGQASQEHDPLEPRDGAERLRLAARRLGVRRQVRRYRISFTGPKTPRGFRWLIEFESVRRAATVFLNGRRLGKNIDPYTPFTFEAARPAPRPHEPAASSWSTAARTRACPRAGGTGAASCARST